MSRPSELDRLTASDLFLLLWDDYGWSDDIGALAVLDGTTLLDVEGLLRIEAVGATWSRGCSSSPASARAVPAPEGHGVASVVDAPTVEPARHVRVRPLDAPGDRTALVRACQDIAQASQRDLVTTWPLVAGPVRCCLISTGTHSGRDRRGTSSR